MYSMAVAYLLWLLGGGGVLGFHRFYLGKIPTGVLYFFTGGLFWCGAVIDFFRMPTLVREANLRLRYREALLDKLERPGTALAKRKESVEKIILRTAKKNKGVATPAEVALEGDISIEEARKNLDKLASKGFAEMRVKESGTIVYCFPEFMHDDEGFVDM
jgi:hypothetical protein